MDVEVVAPAMGYAKYAISLADFEASNDGTVIAWPQGHAPMNMKKKETRQTATFESEKCFQCAHEADCTLMQVLNRKSQRGIGWQGATGEEIQLNFVIIANSYHRPIKGGDR